MKQTIVFMAIFFSATVVFAQSADAVLGKWLNSGGEAHIQIYKTANKYNGKLTWFKKAKHGKPIADINNPDVKLRERALLGLEMLKGFSFNDGAWALGTIYDPKTGKTYSGKLTLIGRTEVWTRVK